MTETIINQRECAELMLFLEREDQFLTRVSELAASIAEQPVGRSFNEPLIEQIAAIQRDAGRHHIERANFRSLLARCLPSASGGLRLSRIDAGPEWTRQLQRRREQVLHKTLVVSASLRIMLSQLRESNVIVTAVLECVLGVPVDRSRYDSDGKPVQQFSHMERQRVA